MLNGCLLHKLWCPIDAIQVSIRCLRGAVITRVCIELFYPEF